MNINAVYVESVVAWHNLCDRTKESLQKIQDANVSEEFRKFQSRTRHTLDIVKGKFVQPSRLGGAGGARTSDKLHQDFSHIFRRKTRWELILLSGAVCGIEFCYAAETAFVTPILLSLGLDMKFMTMIWCLSPLVGFFLTPLLGSLSDSCGSSMGRRRPFIIGLSFGILLGLILVPNGQTIGRWVGDEMNPEPASRMNSTTNSTDTFEYTEYETSLATEHKLMNNSAEEVPPQKVTQTQTWSIFFTIIGAVLLDFCSDACQSPSRTYLLDVTLPEDHATGLSTFTIMAGFGGSIGYLMGAVNWEATLIGQILGGHVRSVFSIVTFLFVICLMSTITSFPEIPLHILQGKNSLSEKNENTNSKLYVGKYSKFSGSDEEEDIVNKNIRSDSYGSLEEREVMSTSFEKENVELKKISSSSQQTENVTNCVHNDGLENHLRDDGLQNRLHDDDLQNHIHDDGLENRLHDDVTVEAVKVGELSTSCDQPDLKEYLLSILRMPKSLRILCVTNLFCWMSLVCYSLYFTNFVGESVYGGDPQASADSIEFHLYEEGVRFGCWGMALYSISCSFYSYCIESLVRKFGAKLVYIGGQLIYSVGMILMAVFRHRAAVIILSPAAGIMYATLFTMPYLLIAHYHCMQTFEAGLVEAGTTRVRGIGTDVATVSSMVFLSQFVLSLSMGSIIAAVKSSVATVCAAAILSACGALSATQVFYLDL